MVSNYHTPDVIPPATGGLTQCWPHNGEYVIRTHGSVKSKLKLGVVTAICRNSEGVYQGSYALVLPGMTSAHILDALACREAQALAEGLGVRKITITGEDKQTTRDI